jgi:hypothetical protein
MIIVVSRRNARHDFVLSETILRSTCTGLPRARSAPRRRTRTAPPSSLPQERKRERKSSEKEGKQHNKSQRGVFQVCRVTGSEEHPRLGHHSHGSRIARQACVARPLRRREMAAPAASPPQHPRVPGVQRFQISHFDLLVLFGGRG